MGGIIIKHKIILLTKKRLIIYTGIILIIVFGLILTLKFWGNREEKPTSGYFYLEYKDGKYVGVENTDKGEIKVQVLIAKNKIKNIKILDFPQEYIKDNNELKDEITAVIGKIIKTQEVINVEDMEKSSYIINKLLKAVSNALEESYLS
ncbi:MAG: hypothetical protein M0P77_04590 [Firmicutes bacterium]|nr:hypothetical protein [Bacillota bacterium]